MSAENDKKVVVIDPSKPAVLRDIEFEGGGVKPMGKTLYTANGPGNDVSVVAVASLKVTNKIKVGDRPWGVAILTR